MSEKIKKCNRRCGYFEIVLTMVFAIFFIWAATRTNVDTFIFGVVQCIQLGIFILVSKCIEHRKAMCCYILVRALFNVANAAVLGFFVVWMSTEYDVTKYNTEDAVFFTFLVCLWIHMLIWALCMPFYGCCCLDQSASEHDSPTAQDR